VQREFKLIPGIGIVAMIIEALEGQIGRDFTSDFGIVLMTPDDFGYAKKDGQDKAEPRRECRSYRGGPDAR
jgi:predicted nucleotide-binding protein